MPAPKGNQYAANARRWRTAIDKALENRSKAKGQEELVRIADAMLDKAAEGDMVAIRELGDRMDGKPSQALIHQGDEDNPIRTVTEVELIGFNDEIKATDVRIKI